MLGYIENFDNFVNEELNLKRVSDDECYLTRNWYYYNADDDIVYGSDEKPYGCPFMFENNEEYGMRLFVFDLNNGIVSEYSGEEEITNCLSERGYRTFNLGDMNGMQDFFENDDHNRYILLDGTRMLASSFDVIEEN